MRQLVRFGSVLLLCACSANIDTGGNGGGGGGNRDAGGGGRGDLAGLGNGGDLGAQGGGGDLGPAAPNACGDTDPSCTTSGYGPSGSGASKFPLQTDTPPDPKESDQGVNRDGNGWLGLDTGHATFDFLWIANAGDWSNRGTVSKVNSRTVREVARYFTVTCNSLKTGSKAACDGTNGCCANDDYVSFQNRLAGMPSGKHQQIQLDNNYPSRTAVDYNGDVWVANRAFGFQSSVSKIANDPSECIDRNGNNKIDTSNDVNGDGQIATDCNADGMPDDIASVQQKPCTNGMAQEFYGLDDECVLFTTNTNATNQWGRPLALGQGSIDFGPSDAWAGTFNDGKFFRIDGVTGMTKAQAQLPVGQINPYGATVDAQGYLWAVNLGGGLAYFDTGNPSATAMTRKPAFGLGGYGIALDRDQNVWMAGYGGPNAYRYTPNRTGGFAGYGQGTWTVFTNPGTANGASGSGRGIAADSRNQQTYYAWMARDAGGYVVRIDASKYPPTGQDQQIDASTMPAIKVAGGNTIGAGVDVDQNIWGISNGGSIATRIAVDMNGNATMPNITAPPAAGMKCPGGDTCGLKDNQVSEPAPYTYSDFTGFGLRNFTNPKGTYSYLIKGCNMAETKWVKLVYQAMVPAMTTLTVKARSGNTPVPDTTWGAWTTDYATSPVDLVKGMLMPNGKMAGYLQVEFDFSTTDKTSSPKLQGFNVVFECGSQIG